MAETTEYKVIVDTEVTGQDQIDGCCKGQDNQR